MTRARFLVAFVFSFAVLAYSQNTAAPPKLDVLLQRATQFRQILAKGDRVKASEFVSADKRKDFLNKPTAPIENARTIGLDFADKDHVYVKITGQTVVATGGSAQMQEPLVEDLWVWEKNSWFYEPGGAGTPFSSIFTKNAASDATALKEIKSSFKLLTDVIDIGDLWQGERKQFPVKFQYSGQSVLHVSTNLETPVTMLDGNTTQYLDKNSNHFEIIAGSDDFDGPFDIPLEFTVYYNSVALDQTIRIKGRILEVFKYRQSPDTVAPDSKEEFSISIKNNTDEQADFGAIYDEGKFFVADFPHKLKPGEEGVIRLKRNIAAKTPGNKIGIVVENNLKGKSLCEIRIH